MQSLTLAEFEQKPPFSLLLNEYTVRPNKEKNVTKERIMDALESGVTTIRKNKNVDTPVSLKSLQSVKTRYGAGNENEIPVFETDEMGEYEKFYVYIRQAFAENEDRTVFRVDVLSEDYEVEYQLFASSTA